MTSPHATIEPRFSGDGLVPVVVQDEADRRVLMVAHADAEAIAATLASGEMHFHSRSRGRLWRKGETSGNVLHVVRLDLDCDADAILATVRPHGPTCHLGTRSCFDPAGAPEGMERPQHAEGPSWVAKPQQPEGPDAQDFAWLETLWQTIERRRAERPEGSYTASLLDGGVDAAARKVAEEATEVLIAAKDDAAAAALGQDQSATTRALVGEAADLLFHTMVLLAERGIEPRLVIEALRARHAG